MKKISYNIFMFVLIFITLVLFTLSGCDTVPKLENNNIPVGSLISAAGDVQRASSDMTKISSEVGKQVIEIKEHTSTIRQSTGVAKDINANPVVEEKLNSIDNSATAIRDAASSIASQMLIADRISESSSRSFQIVFQSAQELTKMEAKVKDLESENERIRNAAIQEIYNYVKWFFGIGVMICIGGAVVGYLVNKKLGMLLGGIGILTLTLALGITYYMEYIALAGTIVLGVGVLVTLGILGWVTIKEKDARTDLAGAAEQTVQLVEELKKELPQETKEKFFGVQGICEQVQNPTTKKIVKKIKSGVKNALDPYGAA
jgi:predicted RND superfamily exporter protein